LAQSISADTRIRSGQSRSLLDGIPLAIKDNFCTTGVRTSACSKMLHDFISPYDSTVVSRLRDAGAVFVGKTNMDEFGMGSFTTFSHFSNTINPWTTYTNSRQPLTAGGSSGGSAAAVASRSCFGALGSDTGGSVRLPASYCGVVGLKPTYGRTSRYGLIAYASSLDCPGVITKTVEDARMLLRIIEGVDSRDSTTVDVPATKIDSSISKDDVRPLLGLRIGIPQECHVRELPPEIVNVWHGGANLLAELGAEICTVSLPSLPHALPVYYIVAPAEAASNLARYDGGRYGYSAYKQEMLDNQKLDVKAYSLSQFYTNNRSTAFGAEVQRRILLGTFVSSSSHYQSYLKKAQQIRKLIAQDMNALFINSNKNDGVHFFLTPTATSAAPTLQSVQDKALADPVHAFLNDVMTIAPSLAGLPAISIPFHLPSTGHLPIGLQLIGPSFSESGLLDVASALENRSNYKLPSLC
jgi:aspartyl-tRNA(Asn)/glutamyl-tRNA(Gln) amidotransferase subunit A